MLTLRGREAGGDEADPEAAWGVALPTIGTLLATGAVASSVCRTPDRPFTSWVGLWAYAAGYVLLAAAVHCVAVWTTCTAYRGMIEAPQGLVRRGAWRCAGLLPATGLLAHEGSAWAAGLLPMMAVAAVLFVRRAAPGCGKNAHAPAPAGIAGGGATYDPPPAMLRTVGALALVAVLLELGLAMLASWQYALAGLLFRLGVMVVMWRMVLRLRVGGGDAGGRGLARDTAVALLLTVLALLPSFNASPTSGVAGRLLGVRRVLAQAAPPPVHGRGSGGALSGVILTLPPKPKQRIVLPEPVGLMRASGAKVDPLILPFDGAYWYFRSPDAAPRPGAKTVRGDPTKVEIRSTDGAALAMEAHQRLSPPLGTDCCSEIRVTVRNADVREGAIGLELVLGGASGKGAWRESLGTVVIPSSVGANRTRGAEEVLRFPVPAGGRARWFGEMTVVVRPARERARVGAQVAIERVELMPKR